MQVPQLSHTEVSAWWQPVGGGGVREEGRGGGGRPSAQVDVIALLLLVVACVAHTSGATSVSGVAVRTLGCMHQPLLMLLHTVTHVRLAATYAAHHRCAQPRWVPARQSGPSRAHTRWKGLSAVVLRAAQSRGGWHGW